MDRELLTAIIKHVLSNLMVIPSKFINADKSMSLESDHFLLKDKISLEINDEVVRKNLWGCELLTEGHLLKILFTSFSAPLEQELYLIVQLEGAPAYGLYYMNHEEYTESVMSCSVNDSGWLDCNTYLQATFLAAMEQIKNVNYKWEKCKIYTDQLKLLKSFIGHIDDLNEAEDEG